MNSDKAAFFFFFNDETKCQIQQLGVKANVPQPWGMRLLSLEAMLFFSRLLEPGGMILGLLLLHISPSPASSPGPTPISVTAP